MTKILDQLFTKSQITLLVVQDVLSTFNDSPNSTKNANQKENDQSQQQNSKTD